MSGPHDHDGVTRALDLVRVFHSDVADFGHCTPCDAESLPEGPRRLLDHASHMTVAMERFHGGPVALEVVATRPPSETDRGYAREILLLDQRGRRIQYGIVRIDLDMVPPAVAERIRAADTPLGRVLIDAGCLCDVQQVRLLEVMPGPHLAAVVGQDRTFGRVATIAVGGRPAVDLLEVVAGCDVSLAPLP